MKSVSIVLLSLLLLIGAAYAVKTISVNTPGHIHINGGNNAGLRISPSTIEFGNVTAGSPANVTIAATDTGNCKENVTLVVSSPNATTPQVYSPFILNPTSTITFLAQYSANQTLTMGPGDYFFTLSWTAKCI
jgi:hypothetical protein